MSVHEKFEHVSLISPPVIVLHSASLIIVSFCSHMVRVGQATNSAKIKCEKDLFKDPNISIFFSDYLTVSPDRMVGDSNNSSIKSEDVCFFIFLTVEV